MKQFNNYVAGLRILVFVLFVSFFASAEKPGGLEVVAKDSSASMKFNLRMQTLFTAQKFIESSDWSTNFITRRARLKFGGWAFNPNFKYKMELGLSNRDIGSSSDFEEVNSAPKYILDAVVKYRINRNLTLWFGQTKLPGNRERVISSQNLQFVDRSLVNSRFNIDRDQGIQFHFNFKLQEAVIKPILSISKGEGRNVTISNLGGFDYTGRIEYLPFGEFESKGDYFGSDLKREDKPKLAIGVTYDYNEGASRERAQLGDFLTDSNSVFLTTDLSTIFADLMFKYNGISIMAEYANKESSEMVIAENGKKYVTGSGFVTQMGYLFKNNMEIAFRYTELNTNDEMYSGLRDTNEYTLGVSKYIDGHRLKFQSDVSIIDVEQNNSNQIRFRLQFELGI